MTIELLSLVENEGGYSNCLVDTLKPDYCTKNYSLCISKPKIKGNFQFQEHAAGARKR